MNFIDLRILSYLFLPILSFLILILFGNKLKEKSHFIALPLIGLTLLNSIQFLFFEAEKSYSAISNSFEWFNTGSFIVSLGYVIDNVTIIMLCVVSLISFLVHLYSTEYMKDDLRYSRYFAFLGIFTFSSNEIAFWRSLI